ncbi:MAG: cyclic nucleotide-binding domain-containing protein [Anaerolineales bacterium]
MPTDPSYLRNFSCFQDLSESQLDAIAELTNSICFSEGHVLFEEGKPAENIYLLIKGEVEVLYKIGDEGPVRVDIVSDEEVVGCAALVPPYVCTATVRSMTEIEVLELDAVALQKLMQEDCALGFSIQQQIMRMLLDRIMNYRLGS